MLFQTAEGAKNAESSKDSPLFSASSASSAVQENSFPVLASSPQFNRSARIRVIRTFTDELEGHGGFRLAPAVREVSLGR
jgi:hypothetical protein